MTLSLLEQCLWKEEVLADCGTLQRFLDIGFGVCGVMSGLVVSEAYASVPGDRSYAIGAVVRPEFRRHGLAYATLRGADRRVQPPKMRDDLELSPQQRSLGPVGATARGISGNGRIGSGSRDGRRDRERQSAAGGWFPPERQLPGQPRHEVRFGWGMA